MTFGSREIKISTRQNEGNEITKRTAAMLTIVCHRNDQCSGLTVGLRVQFSIGFGLLVYISVFFGLSEGPLRINQTVAAQPMVTVVIGIIRCYDPMRYVRRYLIVMSHRICK